MIKVPVSRKVDEDRDFIYEEDIFYANGVRICECEDVKTAIELINIINSHKDLVRSLTEMVEIVGGNFCQNMEIRRKYKNAKNILEKLI